WGEYGLDAKSIVCMRKHLLWYLKGWQGAKVLKEEVGTLTDPLECDKELILPSTRQLATSLSEASSMAERSFG
ncbi:MAG: hypothetical protein KA436_12745, partial [Oligoflexales bacterium]|nr:hypothetical protein [Oligoflexales bacterium]